MRSAAQNLVPFSQFKEHGKREGVFTFSKVAG